MSSQIYPSLPFDLIERVVGTLRDAGEDALRDLVMILPRDESGSVATAVYNRKGLPTVNMPWEMKTLNEIGDDDILNHQQLIVAWSGLDTRFPSLIPYGLRFYHLRRIFLLLDQVPLGMATAWRLAQALQQDLAKASDAQRKHWAAARIIQLGLPYWLRKRKREGLLGLVIPDVSALFAVRPSSDHGPAIQRLYLEEMSKSRDWGQAFHPSPGSWIVALPEVHEFGFLPHIHPQHQRFLQLRPILQAATWEADLLGTVNGLAQYAWAQWRRTEDKIWRARAYRLSAEVRFVQEDPTTIVALRPNNDFNSYLQDGSAIRYQRTPVVYRGEESSPGEMRHVLTLAETETLPKGFDEVILRFPILKEDADLPDSDQIDLCEVLLRAGRKHELARALWLFARELLPPLPSPDWKELKAGMNMDEAMDHLFVAYYFYNLLDPWRWRQGRYPFFIRRIHLTLGEILKNIARDEASRQDPTQHYTQALRAWYGGVADFGQDIPSRLSAMMEQFRRYLEAAPEHPADVLRERRRRIAQDFIRLGTYLLDLNQAHLPKKIRDGSDSMPGLYRRLTNLLQASPFFAHTSPFFHEALQRYHPLRETWLQFREAAEDGNLPSKEDLQRLINAYDALERSTFSLRHESEALAWLFNRDKIQIQHLLDALSGGPVFQFRLLNPWVIRDHPDTLTLEIANVGQDTAHAFQLTQTIIQGADAIVQTNAPLPGDLARHEARTWRWRVRAQGELLTMKLHYTYRDDEGNVYNGEHALDAPVRGRRAQLPLVITNPYRAGTPVYGPDLFRGREEILRSIFSRLLSGNTQPILLRGPRRIGKTSILRQIQWMMEDWAALETLGLQRNQLPFLQRQLVVSASLQVIDPTHPDYTRLFFEHILNEIHRQAQIREPLHPEREGLASFPAVAFRKILTHWIETVIQAPVIILLDEWDEIYREEFQGLARNLRAMIEHRQLEHVNWIISSTWVMVREVAQFGSPFYNQTYNLEVGPLTWDAARRLVVDPSDRVGVDWQGEAVVAVLEATGRRPYLLQLACSKALDELARDPSSRQKALVSVDILHRALASILQDAQSSDQYFGFLWDVDEKPVSDEDQVNSVGRLILWALAEHYPRPLSRLEILDALRSAFREQGYDSLPAELLETRFQQQMSLLHRIFDAIAEQNGRYTLSIPLIHAWLKERLALYGPREALIRHLYDAVLREMDVGQT